jgi:L-proline amide hydrolase
MTASQTEGFAPFREWQTWYRITGDPASGKPPLVLLHGGPGATHDYLDSLQDLASTGRAVVHYDQLGCGLSSHLPEKGADFWTPALFIDELNNLLQYLGFVEKGYDVLGQSWGGMLGAEFAVTHPAGLRKLIIANSPASMVTWVEQANILRAALPAEVQATLLSHEAAGTTASPEYEQAVGVFYARHLCRVEPMPDYVLRSFAQIAQDPTVYPTMNGPSEFYVVGTLKSWSIVDRLGRVAVPTLLISGAHDEATLACVEPYLRGIRDVRWHIFGNSSHMPHVEEKAEYISVVSSFLDML